MRLLRLPLVLARVPLEVAKGAFSLAGGLLSRDRPEPPVPTWDPPPAPPRRRVPERPPPPPRPRTRGPREPVHVSEEPVLVAEVAEQGAEEGAGAEVRVEEPWAGYTGMTATQIKTRLNAEPPAVAAAVSLFEAGNKGRSSVLEAAARRTRR